MFEARLNRLSRALCEHGLDALALNPGPTLFYLTGLPFHLMERPVVMIVRPDQPPWLVLPELERARAESGALEARLLPYGEDEASRGEAFRTAAGQAGLADASLGAEPLRLRMLELRLLEAAAPGVRLVSAAAALEPLRLCKQAGEVEAMRQAVRVAEAALEATLPQIRRGMQERELAAELTLQLLRAGSESELPFSPIVACGPHSALPHHSAGERRLAPGDLLILDWGATVSGYISDLTRTFGVGEIDPELARVHEIVQQANAAGRWAARPGAACGDVDAAARAIIEAAGYGERFIHRTGHGIGLEAHEPPYIRQGEALPLAPGMTFTVEPGIYLPGRGGVRVEDNLLITLDGGESLSACARELRSVG